MALRNASQEAQGLVHRIRCGVNLSYIGRQPDKAGETLAIRTKPSDTQGCQKAEDGEWTRAPVCT